jgi:hypothetical protein
MSHARVVIAAFAVALFAQGASALTRDQPVTPEFLKQEPGQFKITAEKRADGLVHFTITRLLARPAYLVARSTIRDGDKLLLDTTSTAFAREPSATYYVAVSAERMANATFELFEGGFGGPDNDPLPVVGGGTNFQIQLAAFAKSAGEAK